MCVCVCNFENEKERKGGRKGKGRKGGRGGKELKIGQFLENVLG